ncbi:hypothetical protein IW140_004991 [Coemansia sp. RSA 1813]|nr:hypothetical protein EV178_006141 [Coemansia sp. RSA 1646]KAJ1766292.1 hypothetical protein LPJ74_005954 [Coemansia sp. RSA 1843]KAJ2085525.1 hypothetical protein IW138_006275 [Coemansia sp. RSA 986]KAJ2212994.1 hypothetical protein EV179_004222 [Coemansia sp. RSA 487]KAJ2566303.1 hypothetical protein IW140_004991 [Coemansia sp. RSA 1813]
MGTDNDDSSECTELQHNEMEVLTAIYDDSEFSYTVNDTSGLVSGSFSIQLDEVSSQEILLRAEPILMQGNIEFLPPIGIEFQFPSKYPLKAAPTVQVSCIWLSDESVEWIVNQVFANIWVEEHDTGGVLSSYIDAVRHSLASVPLGDSKLSDAVREDIILHDRKMKRIRFEARSYTCPICMEEQAGVHFLQFECTHVSCKQCLAGYIGILVNEGQLAAIGCPDPDCIKDSAKRGCWSIARDVLSEILTPMQLARYDELSTKYRVESDNLRYAWCPRAGCGRAVERDKGMENLCMCSCGYVFCLLCLHTWHGIGKCPVDLMKIIADEYGDEYSDEYEHYAYDAFDDETRPQWMERIKAIYGAAKLESVLKNIKDNMESKRLISDTSKPCPECKRPIYKTDGCNHMKCSMCGTDFCYLCGAELEVERMYEHFNLNGSPCNQQLFGVIPAEEEEGLVENDIDNEEHEANMLIALALE